MSFNLVQHYDSSVGAEDFVLSQNEIWSREHTETGIGDRRLFEDQSIRQTMQGISTGVLHTNIILANIITSMTVVSATQIFIGCIDVSKSVLLLTFV